jgi:hypothetical protein
LSDNTLGDRGPSQENLLKAQIIMPTLLAKGVKYPISNRTPAAIPVIPSTLAGHPD